MTEDHMGNHVEASLLLDRHHDAVDSGEEYCKVCFLGTGWLDPVRTDWGHATLATQTEVRHWLMHQDLKGVFVSLFVRMP